MSQRENVEGVPVAEGALSAVPESAGESGGEGMQVRLVTAPAAEREFLRLPWSIYAGDPCWVPPLWREEKRLISRRANPFFAYGSADLLGAYDASGTLVGRVAAIHNPRFSTYHSLAAGFFGMFECIHDLHAASLLLNAVRDRLSRKGCRSFFGPATMTPNEELGVLIEGSGSPPMVLTNYAPSYYGDLLETCGLRKAVDLLSYVGELGHRLPVKFDRVLASARARTDVQLRTFDRARWETEIETIRVLYNASFTDSWGFVPMTVEDARNIGRLLRFSDEKLVTIAECEGQPAGCILAALDANEVLKQLNGRLFPFGALKLLNARRSISGIRVMVLCVLPRFRSRGIESLLIDAVHRRMIVRGYRRAEFSFVLDNNFPMRRILEALGFKRTKVHRVYEGSIDLPPAGLRIAGGVSP